MSTIKAIRTLAEKATPGKWSLCRPEAISSDHNGPLLGQPEPVDGPFIADCSSFNGSKRMKEQSAATAEYIIAMHEALPALLAVASAAQEHIAVLSDLPVDSVDRIHTEAVLRTALERLGA